MAVRVRGARFDIEVELRRGKPEEEVMAAAQKELYTTDYGADKWRNWLAENYPFAYEAIEETSVRVSARPSCRDCGRGSYSDPPRGCS
jgi:hypothetical protein